MLLTSRGGRASGSGVDDGGAVGVGVGVGVGVIAGAGAGVGVWVAVGVADRAGAGVAVGVAVGVTVGVGVGVTVAITSGAGVAVDVGVGTGVGSPGRRRSITTAQPSPLVVLPSQCSTGPSLPSQNQLTRYPASRIAPASRSRCSSKAVPMCPQLTG